MIILIWSLVIGTLSSATQVRQEFKNENESSNGKGTALAVANNDLNQLNQLAAHPRKRRLIFTALATGLALGAKALAGKALAVGAKVGAKYALKYGAKYGSKYALKYAKRHGYRYVKRKVWRWVRRRGGRWVRRRVTKYVKRKVRQRFRSRSCRYLRRTHVYLSGYPRSTGKRRYRSRSYAIRMCNRYSDCGGVTYNYGRYELRAGRSFRRSPSREVSYLKYGC